MRRDADWRLGLRGRLCRLSVVGLVFHDVPLGELVQARCVLVLLATVHSAHIRPVVVKDRRRPAAMGASDDPPGPAAPLRRIPASLSPRRDFSRPRRVVCDEDVGGPGLVVAAEFNVHDPAFPYISMVVIGPRLGCWALRARAMNLGSTPPAERSDSVCPLRR